ncbi:MAG: signal recognition particle protein [Erysipelotrichaceae bacterium]
MAFDNLSNRLNKAFKNITGKGKLTEKNMNEMLREVRMSLLEADVNYSVVKDFIETIKTQAMGTEVMSSLNPGQMVVKIVRDELVKLLGEENAPLNYSGMTSIMMVGLQGTGKTTASAKIANLIAKKQARKPLLVACDIVRPAAIEQLITLGKSINVEVFSKGVETPAVETAQMALDYAKANGYDTVIFDTAGRLHIDEVLMQELVDIKTLVKPNEILLTVDAMTGQDIVNVAKSFHDTLDVTGLILNKLDGDSRGGGILSVRAITKVPVKFVGLGEKIDDLDVFYPDRMADRILGMGDILTLVEQAQDKMDVDVATKSAERMMSGVFTLDDMLAQFQQVSKMGSLGNLMKMVPGMNQMAGNFDEDKASVQMKKSEAIILSMTKEERANPSLLKASRKSRIAKGSGVQVADVNRLLSQFEKTKTAMKQMSQMMKGGKMPNMGGMGKKAAGFGNFGRRKF